VPLYSEYRAVTLFYTMLFLACLGGVCAIVLIGDKLRGVYVDWRDSSDIVRRESPHAASAIPHSAFFEPPSFSLFSTFTRAR
jgi:hypothetical protein